VVRPGRASCDARAALSWDFGALRGRVPSRRDGHGFRRPARRFDALRATAGTGRRRGLLRATPSVRLPIPFRGPSQHPRTVPGSRRNPRRTMLPPLGFFAPRHLPERRCVSAGRPAPQRVAGGLGPPLRHSPPSLREPCGPRASTGFTLQGVLLAPVGLPLGSPCPPAVARVDSPRSSGTCGHGRLQGLDPGVELVRSVAPLRARRVDAFLGFVPPERSPPPSSRALLNWRPVPHHALGGNDVPTRLRLEVLRSGGIGWPLSGLPALLGFLTFRPSRHRKGRAEGGLMVSPLDSPRVRATNRSMPSRDRPWPTLAHRPGTAVHR